MIKTFLSYFKIGIINTILHWSIFFISYKFIEKQYICNSLAFIVSTTFSFFMNAKFTFKKQTNIIKYFYFTSFMFLISFVIGKIGDDLNFYPIFTLILFSGISLILGFIFSKYIVFKK